MDLVIPLVSLCVALMLYGGTVFYALYVVQLFSKY